MALITGNIFESFGLDLNPTNLVKEFWLDFRLKIRIWIQIRNLLQAGSGFVTNSFGSLIGSLKTKVPIWILRQKNYIIFKSNRSNLVSDPDPQALRYIRIRQQNDTDLTMNPNTHSCSNFNSVVDLHHFWSPDPDPHQIKIRIRIRIRIEVIICIRIRINLQTTSQNVWNMSLFEHFFKGLSLYLEARIRIRIRIRGKKSDPDPNQRDADPQHWQQLVLFSFLRLVT